MKRLLPVLVVIAACGRQAEQAAPSAGSGSAAPITEAEYAAKLIPFLAAHDPGQRLRYDPVTRMIRDDAGDRRVAIGNLYLEYLATPAAEQPAALRRVATSLDMSGADSLPAAEARTRMRPVVRAGMYFDLEVQEGKASSTQAMSEPLGDASAIGIGVDSADSIMVATTEQLANWKISFAEAKGVAIANLRAMDAGFDKVAPGVWTSTAHDNYDSSRLLLVDEIKALGLSPPVVAMIPNRDSLFLASGKDAKALLAMADLAETAAGEPRPIHTVALCLANKLWSECEPAITPAVKARYHSLAARGWIELYDEQHDPLQTLVGEDVFVANLTAVEDKAKDRIATYAAWTRTVPTLLPRAEVITLVEVDANGKGKVIGMVSWSRLMAVVGDRVKRDTRSPPRWSTGDYFPSDAELAKLALVDDPFVALAR